jgi:hypothetical protein
MKLGIMQPYFFPYIGYFQLINAVDEFILFDVVQYIERGWINRNRILSSNLDEKWSYIIVPLKKHKNTDLISTIEISYAKNWTETIKGQLSYYKKIRAPFYNEMIKIIESIFEHRYKFITELNNEILTRLCNYLGLKTRIKICSDLNFDFSNVENSGDWALEISKQIKTSLYINPIGGKDLFNIEKFNNNGIDLKFLKSNEIIYKQSRRDFVPWLSIIDVMMFNSKDEIKKMLNEYELI